ncbi:MAG TPA: bifunctional serine/threonine-protein kinase/ABC transporter substrate-binding protein, partial [Kofleriaceae bacterium]|nr:bifunctional serine/threonine-protein kinase/ABC transporter substrate-binding protein [Kofleriaceae bacterium]
VEGLSLRELFRSPRTQGFAPAIWLRVIADALSGLSHAHGLRDYDGKPLGVVHRDISPHNIVVSYDGVTKLLDFGIASASLTGRGGHGNHGNHGIWEPGAVTGKVAYMAPEQALGKPDRRSDLFAMGVVLWEMLAGCRLFEGESADILRRLAHDPIPRLASCVPDIDPELDELVARALEKDPPARFQTANEMRQAIERHLRKAGHVVRELEVGEAISTAFADVRAALRARIREAMAATGELPGLSAGEPEGPPGLARARTPRHSEAAIASQLAPAQIAQASGARLNRVLAIAGALGLVAVISSAVTLATRRGDPGGDAMRAAAARPAGEVARPACTTPIRVRVMYDMTGATKDVGIPAGKGEHDYLRAINAAGGIRGCKLDIDVQDTQYDKRASLEVYARWKARPEWPEVSTLFLQGTPMTQAIGPLAATDGKVIVSGAYAGELAAPGPTSVDVSVPSLGGAFAEASLLVKKQSPGYPNVFFQGTDYTTAARVAANFAWRQGARRMAFFYCSTSAFCTEPVDGAKTFLKQLGGTEVGRDLFIELDDDTATVERKVVQFFHEERLYKAAHPDYEIADWIWFGNTSTNTASLGRALKKAKDQYRLDIHVIGNNWSLDETLYRRCGDACIGFDVVQPFGLFGDPTASGTRALLADHASYRKLDGDPPDAYQTVQYVYGRVAVAAWKIAVERLLDAGKPVTGSNLRQALEAFRHVDIEGFATIDYSPADHRPQSGARITRLGAHGRMETIGQPLSLSLQDGWLGW